MIESVARYVVQLGGVVVLDLDCYPIKGGNWEESQPFILWLKMRWQEDAWRMDFFGAFSL